MSTYKNIRYNAAIQAGVTGTAISYANAASLPLSGLSIGELALTDSNTLYITNGSGWYKIATTNETPSITLSVDTVNTEPGSNTVSATYTITEPEGTPTTDAVITYDFTSNANIVHYTGNTTLAITNQNTGTYSGDIIISVSDGVNIGVATLTLNNIVARIVENSKDTALLVKATGNAGTNTTFTDDSTNSHSITVNGNAVAQSFTPYHPGGYSNYFDGSGDYLTAPNNDDFTLSGEFTIEMWVYLDQTSYARTIQRLVTSANSGYAAEPYISIGNDLGGVNAGCLCFTSSVGAGNPQGYATLEGTGATGTNLYFPFKQWVHVALTRDSSNVCRLFQDGNIVATVTISGGFDFNGAGNNGLSIAKSGWSTTEYFGPGYIRDFRIVKGTSVYTADFTPPTETLTAITNTSILTCHLPYFADGSTNGNSITVNGNTITKRFSPYDYIPYDESNHVASVCFDGSGDYLEISDDGSLEFGSGDFTVEFWYYGSDTDQYATLTTKGAIVDGSSTGNWIIILNQYVTGDISIYVADYSLGGPMLNTSGDVLIDNQWNHIAFVRNGTSFNIYVNGVSKASQTSSLTFGNNASNVIIGKDPVYGRDLSGFISDYRIVKGTAVYTSNFTPPTAPLTAITNTELLVQSSPNIFDASGSSKLTLVGDAQSSTTQTKNASSSIYLDGSGDYVYADQTDVGNFGTGDFTIETWFRPTAWGKGLFRKSASTGSTAPPGVSVYFNSGSFYNGVNSTGGTWLQGTNTATLNAWNHYAMVRNNGYVTAFINGTSIVSGERNVDVDNNDTFRIGEWRNGSEFFNGYLEDFKLTKGLSRYPFIPPKETLAAVSNTKLLTAHSETITDGSTSSHTVTTYGDAAVSNFAPAPGMKSIYLDGTGDYLTIAGSTDFAMASNDFTIEFWYYPTSISSSHNIHDQRTTDSQAVPWLGLHSNGYFYYYVSGANRIVGATGSVTANKWYHVAISRVSGTTRLFVNGSQAGSDYSDSTSYVQGGTLHIGKRYTGTALYPIGYLSNYRIVNGTGVYANSFTPPTEELVG